MSSYFFSCTLIALVFLLGTLNGEPERCCVPKQFSAQISTSSGVQLPGGQVAGTYVRSSVFGELSVELVLFRVITISRMMLIEEWWE